MLASRAAGSDKNVIGARRRLLAAAFILSVLVFAPLSRARAAAQAPDQISRYVNDYAGVLSQSDFVSLSTYLQQYERASGNQITVAIIPSLGGDPIEDYSIRLAEKWKIGRKGNDNGAILLIALQDKKMRIEVGYGLEPKLTDATCGDIIRNVIAPHFRDGDLAGGVAAGVEAMTTAIDGKPFGSVPQISGGGAQPAGQNLPSWVVVLGVILFVLLAILIQIFFPSFWGILFWMIISSGGGGGGGWSGGGGGGFGNGGGGGSFGGGGASGGW